MRWVSISSTDKININFYEIERQEPGFKFLEEISHTYILRWIWLIFSTFLFGHLILF